MIFLSLLLYQSFVISSLIFKNDLNYKSFYIYCFYLNQYTKKKEESDRISVFKYTPIQFGRHKKYLFFCLQKSIYNITAEDAFS